MRHSKPALVVALMGAVVLPACGGGGDDGAVASPEPVERKAMPIRCTPLKRNVKDAVITIAPKWAAGDHRTLTITKSRKDSEQPQSVSSTLEAKITVRRRGRKRSLLRLDGGAVDFGDNSASLPARFQEQLREISRNIDIEYATDGDGAFASIENLAAIRTQMQALVPAIDRLVGSDPAGRKAVDAIRRAVESDVFVQQVGGELVGLLHYAYGFELRERDEPREFRVDLPNMFGGEAFPATSTVRLVDRRDSAGCVALEIVTEPDKDELNRIVVDSLERLAGKPVPNSEIPEVRLRNTARYQWDSGSGWIVHVDATKAITTDGRERTDRTVIESR